MTVEAEQRGDEALRTGDWEAARSAFTEVLAGGETPQALDGMARARWWLADPEGAVGYRTRAFSAFRRAGEADAAARVAWWSSR